MVRWQMFVSSMTSSQGAPGASLLFILRTRVMQKRQRNVQMAWSWMVVGLGWTSPSLKDPTPRPLESTWAGPPMVEVDRVALDAIHVITTVVMTADTTEADMIAMMTGTTTDHTEGVLHHRTTEGLTGLDLDRGRIPPVAIELLLFPGTDRNCLSVI